MQATMRVIWFCNLPWLCRTTIGMETTLTSILVMLRLPLSGIALGVCTGMLTGLFGAGGGFILTPALNIFLGLPYNIAVGTSTCQILAASTFALSHHLDRRLMGSRIACLVGLGVPVGTYFGVRVVNRLRGMGDISLFGRTMPGQDFCFTLIFCVFLTLIAGWLLYDNFWLRRGGAKTDDNHKGYLAWIRIPPMVAFRTVTSGAFSAPVLAMLGLCMGFMGGLLGIGGGVIMMPILFYLIGQETKYAALTSTMLVFATALFSTVMHASAGNINYQLVAFLVVGAFIGTRVGGMLQRKLTGMSLRRYFAFVVLAAVIMVLCKLVSLITHAPLIGNA